ncbi:hypothetical protein FF011L_00180 [Roseimaritima multifibrata]|uniref:Uncharacterized protein n=1 Tax=Roseimaritima multifibrata TaxID=1930274 RepID=A0A517M8U1_9BACT|nr:hypothetical protein [Roseimaritima multifibrata]QDS91289.1 hypothetical protein FF011L_00180 [Roseimaritima multifibrata]
MTTSSDNRTPSAPRPNGEHWAELSQTLPTSSVAQLSDWFDTQLAVLEERQAHFITKRSLKKSLRR